jgi:hypothetical protein
MYVSVNPTAAAMHSGKFANAIDIFPINTTGKTRRIKPPIGPDEIPANVEPDI